MKTKALLFALLIGLSSPALATVNSPVATVTANGNGSTTVFNYTFIIPFQANGVTPAVVVQYTDTIGNVTTLVPSVYTIVGVGNPAGGTVTYPLSGSSIATGTHLIITRNLAYIQPTAVNNNSFYPHTVETVADNIVMQVQQLAAKVSGGGGGTFPSTLPGPYANDTVAAANGVPIGSPYRNGAVVQLRVD